MNQPARILHISQPVDGGVARVVVQLCADQQRRGWDVVVASPSEGALAGELEREGVRQVAWHGPKAKRSWRPAEVRALRALVEQVDPDVVHLHSVSAGVAGRLAVRRRRPVVFQPHGWSWLVAGRALRAPATWWERYARRLCDVVVCVSEGERQQGVAGGVAPPLMLVPNGVDIGRFPACTDADRARARAALGLAPQPLAVCVGRLDLQKGQDVLVSAWPAVLALVPGARLALVGDGPARADLEALAVRVGVHGNVDFVGVCSDVAPWYAAADVVALSSRFGEGGALTPMEAQASGRALVVSDVVGVRESVGAGAGAVVPPGDAAAFARELARRLADPALAGHEGRCGRQFAEERLDVTRSLDALAALTLELVHRHRPGTS